MNFLKSEHPEKSLCFLQVSHDDVYVVHLGYHYITLLRTLARFKYTYLNSKGR